MYRGARSKRPAPPPPPPPPPPMNLPPEWFSLALAEPCESLFVKVEDEEETVDIHCLRWGASSSKRPLVFVHGGAASCQWFKFIAPFFAKDFDVLAISNSGNGDSSSRRSSYTLHNWSREIWACCDQLGYFSSRPKPFLVAHSLGTYVTTNMMVNMGLPANRFEALVLCDGAIRSFKMAEKIQNKLLEIRSNDPNTKPREGWNINPPSVLPVDRFKLRPFQDCENGYILDHGGGQWRWKGDFNREAKMDWKRFPVLCDQDVSKICQAGVRVVWMYGEESILCDSSVVEHVRWKLGNELGIVGIPGAAHHLWLDQPLAFVSALRGVFAGWTNDILALGEGEEGLLAREARLESRL